MSALRGVNLGGWLIVEKWMTPSLFADTDAVDEYTFMQTPGARVKLRSHQKNFIREDDFKWMANNGVQAIRIPVGYWLFDGDDPYVSCIGCLDWAFRMAAKYDLQVLVCLHGAPGSQNGHDHSGRIGKALWHQSFAYQQRTLEVLMRIATRYRAHSQFWGLELLNEPKVGLFQLTLRRFYNQAYRQLLTVLRPTTRIIFHDAFTPRLLNGAIRAKDTHPTMMDIHWYHFTFWAFKWLPLGAYYRYVLPWHGRLIISLRRWQGVIVGEWSGIIAGEVLGKYVQSEHATMISEHTQRQLVAYEAADAWFYWSYKTESPGVWSYRSMVEEDMIHKR